MICCCEEEKGGLGVLEEEEEVERDEGEAGLYETGKGYRLSVMVIE